MDDLQRMYEELQGHLSSGRKPEALVELLSAMPDASLLEIICPSIGLVPARIADIRPRLGTVNVPGGRSEPWPLG